MKLKSIILSFLMLGALVMLTSASPEKKAAMVRYTSCGSWHQESITVTVTNPDGTQDDVFVNATVRDCTEYDINWSTFPPTTTTIRSYKDVMPE